MPQLPADIQGYISQRLREILPPNVLNLLLKTEQLASLRGWQIYLVGGYVRDCLLGIPDYDVDVAVEGDAIELARLVTKETGARLSTYPATRTATLTYQGQQFHIDVVTARHEWYEQPGALPTVEEGTILEDLARRDFTINAMAIQIKVFNAVAVQVKSDPFGPLIDPHSGLGDLQAGLISVLHSRSFIDDPTRIFRAVRFAKRLDFKIERDTLELILQAVRDNALSTVSIERITHELLLIMEEPHAGAMLAELDKLGVLRAIHPSLTWPYPDGKMGPAESSTLTKEERRDTYLAILAAEFAGAPEDAEALARYLRLPAPQIRLMRDAARLVTLWPQLGADDLKPSQTYALLHPLGLATLQAYTRITALSSDTVPWSRLNDYLGKLRHIKPAITGDYLREQGVPPGPIYKHLLNDLLNARLNGELLDTEDEERFVRDWLGDNLKGEGASE